MALQNSILFCRDPYATVKKRDNTVQNSRDYNTDSATFISVVSLNLDECNYSMYLLRKLFCVEIYIERFLKPLL